MAGPTSFNVPRKRRARSYRKKSGVFATPAGFTPLGGGFTRMSVLKAAAIFAAQARTNAAKFSVRIPAATSVLPYNEHQAQVVTDGVAAPNAAPFEFGERHPLWGNRKYWRPQPRRAYMDRAARNPGAFSAAAEIYAETETELLAKEFGYTE
jgi:hypothetical protein